MEVRVEAGDSMDLAEGHAQFRGQQLQLFRGQVPEFFLDGTKFWNHAPRRPVKEEEYLSAVTSFIPRAPKGYRT